MRPPPRRTAFAVAAAAACFAGAALLGARRVDAVLAAIPALLPIAWWNLSPLAQRHLLVRQLPVLVLAASGGGIVLAANQAALLGAPVPWLGGLRFGGYLLLWCLALRLLHMGLQAAARRVLHRVAAPIAAGLLVLALGFPNLYVALQTHRIAVAQAPLLPLAVARLAETFVCTAGDGTRLAGTLLPQPGASRETPLVVVCHGLGANRAAFFGYALAAHRLGAHAVAFDFRAHGASSGMVCTLGRDEVHDVAAVVAWLRAQARFRDAPLVLAGVSMGAATALRAASSVGATAVFAESSYADLAAMIDAQTAVAGPLAAVASRAIGIAAAWQLGVEVAAVSPRATLAALPPGVAVVLVHAGDDAIIPPREGERLAAARPGLALHVVAGAPHGGCLSTDAALVESHLANVLAAAARPRGG
ncbi:MAG TPA: alpha/beta fold hydrolase [Planctomycetota bacterium]